MLQLYDIIQCVAIDWIVNLLSGYPDPITVSGHPTDSVTSSVFYTHTFIDTL